MNADLKEKLTGQLEKLEEVITSSGREAAGSVFNSGIDSVDVIAASEDDSADAARISFEIQELYRTLLAIVRDFRIDHDFD